MKASQYLYTSWKNAPNHGFSIYSTSPDVTREESMHIALIMKYRAPSDLPYEPTEEQIATLFPRNTAYFRLPTGRYCIAQSSYVGHEYKGFEEAGRMGNYLTHAYIFDEPAEFYPATFIDAPLFRRDLTLDEWRATNPAPLPVADIPIRGKTPDLSVFLKGKEELLSKLVQAVLDGTGKTIFFNDTQENMKLWYAAIGMCLPKGLNAKFTFDTFSFEDINANFKVPADCRLKIINLTAGGFVPINWQQKMMAGAFVFDFKTQTVSYVVTKQYAQNIASVLSRDASRTADVVAEMERVAAATGTDLDTAVSVMALEAFKFDSFPTNEELGKYYGLALRDPMFRKEQFVEAVLPRLLGDCFAPAANSLLKSFYPLLSNESRRRTVAEISKKYLAQPARNADSYLAEISQNAPFPWRDFALYHYAQEEGMAYFRAYASDFAKANLLIDAAIKAEPELERIYGNGTVKKYFDRMVEFYAVRGENEKVRTLLAIAEKFPNYISLVQRAVDVAARERINLDLYLELVVMQAANPAAVENNIKFLIRNYQDKDEFIRKYDKLAAGSLSVADANLRRDSTLLSFFTELEKYRLTSKDMGIKEIAKFYSDFYLRGEDRGGIILAQIERYLGHSVEESSRPAEAIALYKVLSRIQEPQGEILNRIYRYAFNNISSARMAELIADKVIGASYRNLANVMKAANFDMVNFTVAQFGSRFTDKNFPALLTEAKQRVLYEPLCDGKNTQRLVDGFYSSYSSCVAALAAYAEKQIADKRAKPEEKLSPEEIFDNIFYPLVIAKNYVKLFSDGLISLKRQEDIHGTVAYIISYAATVTSQKDRYAQVFDTALRTYFDALGKGDRKRLFDYARKTGENSGDAVSRYLDNYIATQTTGGLFSRLFGKKK